MSAVATRSSRPNHSPTKIEEAIEDYVVAARKAYPTWGARKLQRWLVERHPDVQFPAPSTISVILGRRGFSTTRWKRQRMPSRVKDVPFAETTRPNDTWCIEFKGQFRTGDGRVCYALTLIDAHARFLLRCEIVDDPDGRNVEQILDSAFREFGLPIAIRSDNGPPFASVGAGGLTRLAVWLIKLGIRLEPITPGKPQQNGRQERFHRTLKAETATPPRASRNAQQRAFDVFRKIYNQERPHEALGMRTPRSKYVASKQRYPRPHLRFQAMPWERTLSLDKSGAMMWRRRKIYINSALVHQDVIFRRHETRADALDIVFGPLSIGVLLDDGVTPAIFKPSTGRMQDTREV